MTNRVDFLMPTYDNRWWLEASLGSLDDTRPYNDPFHVFVINNGQPGSCDGIERPGVTVLQPGSNLGWEGGLKLAIRESTAPFVCFLNDDIFVPTASRSWLRDLLRHFDDPTVGAIGPCSNTVMGMQSIFDRTPFDVLQVRFLIGFCMLMRREALDAAGGIDDTLPGGDDIELSIRLRAAGYTLLIDRKVFVFHQAAVTGFRVHGPEGWYGQEKLHVTHHGIISRHGYWTWYETFYRQVVGGHVSAQAMREAAPD